jgi:hypothetical protein
MIFRIYRLLAFKSVCETQLCAVSRIREAKVREHPFRGAVSRKELARYTPTFAYFRIRGSVVRLQWCAIY